MAKRLSNIVLTNNNITKTVIGLTRIDNTSDLEKPLSTATQVALSSKQVVLANESNIRSIDGANLVGSGSITIAGDVSATGTGSNLNITLNASGVTAGTYNSVTVDAAGRVVAATNFAPVTSSRTMTMSILFGL